jgi:hypothetical protein
MQRAVDGHLARSAALRELRERDDRCAECRSCLNATADAESLAAPAALSRFVQKQQ